MDSSPLKIINCGAGEKGGPNLTEEDCFLQQTATLITVWGHKQGAPCVVLPRSLDCLSPLMDVGKLAYLLPVWHINKRLVSPGVSSSISA